MNSDRRQFLTGSISAVAACVKARKTLGDDRPRSKFVETPCAIIRLPNGRRLAFADFGDPNGSQVIVHHHGFSSCRLELKGYHPILWSRPGVRMIAFDRPGIGRSDPDSCGTFLSWPDDLAIAVDALRIKRFAVMGVSGGTPYALAVARAMSGRVTVVSLACTMAPLEAVGKAHSAGARGAMLAQRRPRISQFVLRQGVAALRRNPYANPGGNFTMSPADREAMSDPQVRQLSLETTVEAFRQGPAEMVRAAAALAKPWACWLKDVRQKVTIFQGCADRITPPSMAQYLVRALPNAEARFFPGEGHMSMGVKFRSEFVSAALGQN